MLRLFNTLNASKHTNGVSPTVKKFTRFEPRHVREAAPQTTCIAQPEHRAPTPVAAYRPASHAPRKIEPVFDDAAHLHSEARVSIAVLRRALPQRFAQMT
ncbi:hypothetical protein KX928_15995 [Roseobacter sp. YSTF-M11]|uniref:Uncharacterized protein n=1 Tax=Roseobacter insulae TaxID=2859783 RepID=A0A9X1FXP9_9RHOB|nr:hypothetical protein [Roseobacter insulae]MBW4709294.1 hypothetical protein [Roseobacter insulae]